MVKLVRMLIQVGGRQKHWWRHALPYLRRHGWKATRQRILCELRQLQNPPVEQRVDIREQKVRKLERIRPLLRQDLSHTRSENAYDFLTEDSKRAFNIVETDAVSSHGYDEHAMRLVEKYPDGLLLDCGAGRRSVYLPNVVNFEIAAYASTDVLGVAEELPFVDNAFDAVISIAVLEHVKDPFRCAREIARVMKPGAELYCAVPFLQPLHGYPNHYYNMTHRGLRNLFDERLVIDDVDVIQSVLPIWSLTWILKSWAEGLRGSTREQFLDIRVRDLVGDASEHLQADFVRELSKEKNLELASACVLYAHKA